MSAHSRFRSYDEAVAAHEWEVPERYNIAQDVCDKHPPEKLAMLWEDYRGNERQVRGASCRTRATGSRSVLRAHGVEAGDRVAMLLTPRPETAAAFLGTFKAGAILLSLSVLYGDEGIRAPRDRLAGEVLVTNAENVERVRALELPVEHVLVLDEDLLAARRPGVRARSTPRPTTRRSSTTRRGRPGSQGDPPRAPLSPRAQRVRALPRRPRRRALPRDGRVGLGGRDRAAARARGATARCRSSTSARAASTRTGSSRSSRSTR